MATVVNIKNEECDVYIGRPRAGQRNKWGNPFKDGSREQNIADYKKHLWQQIKRGEVTISDLKNLRGKRLGCFCKPLPCHGDIIVKAIEWAEQQKPPVTWKMIILYKTSGKTYTEELRGVGREKAKRHAIYKGPDHLRQSKWQRGKNGSLWIESDFCKINLKPV